MSERGIPIRATDICICAMLVISLIVRLALMIGPIGSDDLNYFHFAQLLLHGERFTVLNHHGGRLAFLAIVGLPAALAGSLYAGAIANVLLLSIRDALVILYLRKRVGDAALLSGAAILAFDPVGIVYSGAVLPDGLLSLMMFLSSILAFESVNVAGRRKLWMLAGSGFCAWAAYSIKETGILVVPCVTIWLLIAPSRRTLRALPHGVRDVCTLLGTFVVCTLLEMSIYYHLSGDALYRFHALSWSHNTHGDVTEAKSVYEYVRAGYWNGLAVTRWWSTARPVLLCAAIIWPISLWKRTRFTFFALTGSFIAVYLLLGSSSLTRLIPLPSEDRYFEPVVPFLALAAAGVIASFDTVSQSRRLQAALVATIFLIVGPLSVPAIAVNAGAMAFSSLGKNAAIAIKAVGESNPTRPIYVSPELIAILGPFLPNRVYQALKVIPDAGPLPRGFYLLHPVKDTELSYKRAREVATMPTYIVVTEDDHTFAHFIPELPTIGCVVKYAD